MKPSRLHDVVTLPAYDLWHQAFAIEHALEWIGSALDRLDLRVPEVGGSLQASLRLAEERLAELRAEATRRQGRSPSPETRFLALLASAAPQKPAPPPPPRPDERAAQLILSEALDAISAAESPADTARRAVAEIKRLGEEVEKERMTVWRTTLVRIANIIKVGNLKETPDAVQALADREVSALSALLRLSAAVSKAYTDQDRYDTPLEALSKLGIYLVDSLGGFPAAKPGTCPSCKGTGLQCPHCGVYAPRIDLGGRWTCCGKATKFGFGPCSVCNGTGLPVPEKETG